MNDQQEQWTEMMEQMNDAVAESIEQNMAAQADFVESWAEAVEGSVPDEDVVADGIEGYNRAYEVWMDAAERMADRSAAIAEGEDVAPEEFRDIWLQSANEAFKEVLSTEAFAAANGQLVESMMEMRGDVDEATQDALAQAGLATRDDVEEVGERLVELERRQHAVEKKLDRILEEL
ncbi:poly(R)-hydroxyalkanoic acid synthase subunit PhaE [Salinirussus salinus]|jgi:hypothetical protein|uniref:poly(R)-hydroxyalkanoic acid synthase subunit PhaE n=1 Tax=Salinirussus salinus TaxID=1198300 RepID=UPI001356CA64|nr:poly(R)-hydroxyalkanoic acid synthase subunit PhaE [Salinirussus salinus]